MDGFMNSVFCMVHFMYLGSTALTAPWSHMHERSAFRDRSSSPTAFPRYSGGTKKIGAAGTFT